MPTRIPLFLGQVYSYKLLARTNTLGSTIVRARTNTTHAT